MTLGSGPSVDRYRVISVTHHRFVRGDTATDHPAIHRVSTNNPNMP